MDWNPAAERIFGRKSEDVLGEDLAKIIIPQRFRQRYRDGLQEALINGGASMLQRQMEISALREDGSEFPTEIYITCIQMEPPLFTGFIKDLSERRAAEEKIRQLAAFPELNPDPVLQINRKGQVTYQNRAANLLAESFNVNDFGELLPDDFDRVISECISEGKSLSQIVTSRDQRSLSWSLHPVKDADDFQCYVSEVTDRLKLEEQLRESQKMEAIGQLAGGVAHDFNNILTIIIGNTSMISSEPGVSGEVLDLNRQASEAAMRAAQLTRQLLLFSRRQAMQRKVVDLNEIVRLIARMLGRIVGETTPLTYDLCKDSLIADVDAGMIDQALMNLVVNARDAMPNGGDLRIQSFPLTVSEGEAEYDSEINPGDYGCLRVIDNGVGISKDQMQHIYEPFFTTKETGKGTGLGLSTVFGIVKQHGGHVVAESEEGKGTSFTLFFPLTVKTESGFESMGDISITGGDETILIVEDEPAVGRLMKNSLRRKGYKTLLTHSGKEALEIWDKEGDDVDLLFTDVVMPGGVSGWDLVKDLRERRPSLKVILTSGYSPEVAGAEMNLEKGQHYIQKPSPMKVLFQTIRECLDE